MTPQELFDDTIQHFNSKNRGLSNDSDVCVYWNKTTDCRCAIGRHLPDDICEIGDESDPSIPIPDLAEKMIIKRGQGNLPAILKLDHLFLSNIQALHDDKKSWNENGLSDDGKAIAKIIAGKWKLNYE